MTHRFKWLSRASLLVACALFFAAPAAAQFDRAQLSGRVKDSTGGAVPGATITTTNTQTKTASVAVTDGTGFYTFPNLAPAHYDVVGGAPGFQEVAALETSARRGRLADAGFHARGRRGHRGSDRHR